jgi:hypothetical protein
MFEALVDDIGLPKFPIPSEKGTEYYANPGCLVSCYISGSTLFYTGMRDSYVSAPSTAIFAQLS